ncbi:putative glycoprotein 25l [Paratrimastix pyriformis]|uniref:Glycoprotein 25l n=1 Tax=Paratrimastix pyriformis TaxID=342808 RepID=A0ABQ8UWD0_9EUKA|nr:putative glycoprotein 25l [Paratrimastix pyriformis]
MRISQGVFLLLIAAALGVYVEIEEGQKVCFQEELGQEVSVLVKFQVIPKKDGGIVLSPFTVAGTVKDNRGNTVFESGEVKPEGRFSFISKTSGEHEICLEVAGTQKRKMDVHIDIATGDLQVDYATLARSENLNDMELDLKRIEDKMKSIQSEQAYMRGREAAQRNTDESSNTRVMWFAIAQTVLLLGTGLWQMMHLRRFFRQRKIS